MGTFFQNLSLTKRTSRGFTLIELLVAIGIMAILLTGLLIALNPVAQFKKARDSQRIDDLKSIRTALELYYQDHGRYPANDASTLQIIDGDSGQIVPWGSAWSPYMQTLPKDPVSGRTYIYYLDPSDTTGQTYWLNASLDQTVSATCSNSLSTACPKAQSLGYQGRCNGANPCNYGVSSGNTSP